MKTKSKGLLGASLALLASFAAHKTEPKPRDLQTCEAEINMKSQPATIFSIALVLAALGAVIQQSDAASFVYTGSMQNSRSRHTATLLPNGKVLVAGGFGAGTSAELYDPATGTWTVTGALRAARAGSTATLLPNGKVLVAGGGQAGGSFQSSTSTELFDPATGEWKLTGPMTQARVLHTATLLPNGKVLVIGGPAGGSSELYDPASGTWTETDSASTGYRTLTLLPNGKVLGAGDGAELYDPATGMWTNTGAPSDRYNTATLLLTGRVLVAGGYRISTAELYDPESGTWLATGSLTWSRDFSQATLLRNGQVLVAGGVNQGPDIFIASAELYDVATGSWTEISMNRARIDHTVTLLPNGKALVAGGLDSSFRTLSSAELYEADSGGAPTSLTILHHADEILSFSWNGVGTLEQSDSLVAPNWQPAPIQDNPHIISTTGATQFFRVKAE